MCSRELCFHRTRFVCSSCPAAVETAFQTRTTLALKKHRCHRLVRQREIRDWEVVSRRLVDLWDGFSPNGHPKKREQAALCDRAVDCTLNTKVWAVRISVKPMFELEIYRICQTTKGLPHCCCEIQALPIPTRMYTTRDGIAWEAGMPVSNDITCRTYNPFSRSSENHLNA